MKRSYGATAALTGLLLAAFLLAILPSPAVGNGEHLALQVDLRDTLVFEPALIVVEPGQTVNLTLVNIGSDDHTFTLFQEEDPQTLRQAIQQVDNGQVLDFAATQPTIVDVPLEGDSQRQVEFTAPTQPGEYVYICAVTGHAVGGMWGILQVGQPGDGGVSLVVIGGIVAVVAVVAIAALYFLRRRKAE